MALSVTSQKVYSGLRSDDFVTNFPVVSIQKTRRLLYKCTVLTMMFSILDEFVIIGVIALWGLVLFPVQA